MDFNDTPQEAEFRAKCRAWLEANAELKTKKTNSAKNMNIGNKSLLEAAAEWQKIQKRQPIQNLPLLRGYSPQCQERQSLLHLRPRQSLFHLRANGQPSLPT